MIEVDGVYYSADQVEEAIRDRTKLYTQAQELREKVKKLMGPFTCGHNPEFAGGACAACHAIWIENAEKAERGVDIGRKQFAMLLGEAMNRLCPDQKKCDPGTCPGADLGRWAMQELVPSVFDGKVPTVCPGCSGSGEFGLADGEVACLMCCGSGERNRKGIFYQEKPKCGKCGKQDASVTFAVYLKKPEWKYLCHKCDDPRP
jgi:hypothetical protein